MKVEFWVIGKTSEKYLEEGTKIIKKRLHNYLPFKYIVLPDIKSKSRVAQQLKMEEGRMILSKLSSDDYLVLLDERGNEFDSISLATWMEKKLSGPGKKMIFLVGGAFGFSEELYKRANEKIALSKLTFSHQMVRLFFLEQLYRAMTILKNEPYHNE